MDEHATQKLIDSVAGITCESIPPRARAVARHCVLDWFGVAVAGSREPLSNILVRELVCGDHGDATLLGHAQRASVLDAALINGAASHALDFDDTHTLMSGHPSVSVVPAALALAERDGRDGASFLAAFVAGVEFECRLGALLNPGHYAAGFHATGTLGTFGAAAAAAHLLALDDEQWRNAIGLAGTQAAGLKSGFGTMAKPLHAGRAAANGLTSALLARGGFTANPSVVEAPQGFASTHGGGDLDITSLDRLEGRFLIADTLFKCHASCYLTHAAIEAASKLRTEAGVLADAIESVEIRGSTGCIGVCDIPEPTTGLEGKFSLRVTTAMALLGDDTTDPAAFNDARMCDPALVAMRDRVTFVPQPKLAATRVTVALRAGGRSFEAEADTGRPATDLDRQWEALSAKFFALATPVVGHQRAVALHDAIERLETVPSMRELTALAGAPEDR
nr:MmgE/PrpD family protein [Chloroflexota bacterium]